MERIIVGVDGSEWSADALRWAQHEARIRDATVTALLAWNFLDQHHVDGETTFDPHYGEAEAQRALDVLVQRALGDDADGVRREVVCDLPATALLDASKDADLLVVGARGLGSFRGLVLGSVSQRCLEHASCPVMVVHGTPDDADQGRVVVGVDGSEPSALALEWALEEARRRGATLEVVHSWDVPYAAEFTFVGDAYDAAQGSATDLVDQMLVAAGLAPADVVRTVVQGSPVVVLTDAAAGADLVVVGSRGRGGFAGLLLGSVSHQVSRHAERPVVVVPDPSRADDG
ncbi:universal stress protein [Acidimicrobiia bacterium EGI L10123]|uniref:universal stress protein n=1 Tax=Salinilacustrithrix flava TaxID=2957203 RepID=UPI003D7C3327|nr:universal stress protein [Acidimicrobiia bacterium EGI L10123]